jgi:DNA-binding transcriptional ArsR family regulator
MNQDPKSILEIDRIIHEPARLAILTVLAASDEVEFLFLQKITGLSKGNLSVQAQKLETAGYVQTIKAFRGRMPSTSFRLTEQGKVAMKNYHDQIRSMLPIQP